MKIFLSYTRGARLMPVVERFYHRIEVQLSDAEPFLDSHSIDAGDEWKPSIDAFLADTTHFVAFISIDFWRSPQCRRELDIAIDRYERERAPRLLFVLADPLSPSNLRLDKGAASQRVKDGLETEVEGVRRRPNGIDHINFLGPHDAAGRLVRLELDDFGRYDVQLDALVQKIDQLRDRR